MSAATRRSPVARTAKVFSGQPRNLARLAHALQRGELVAIPTETVYGLAGNALDTKACRAIFKAKGRPSNDPLIVHIHSIQDLDALANRTADVDKLAAAFWPGPLTLVLSKKSSVPDVVTSGGASVAIRCPAHPLFRALLKKCGLPLAAPSANPFGYISPTTAQHVLESLGHRIDYILDGGAAEIGIESTILDLRNPRVPRILRPGAISRDELERVLKRPIIERRQIAAKNNNAPAPGMLSRHYSPRKPLQLRDRLLVSEPPLRPKDAFLFFKRPRGSVKASKVPNIFWLSEKGSLAEAAQNLFAHLRRLDRAPWTHLHAERAPGRSGLARAINDRLTRASAR